MGTPPRFGPTAPRSSPRTLRHTSTTSFNKSPSLIFDEPPFERPHRCATQPRPIQFLQLYANRGKCLGHMVVPSEALLIRQRPKQAQPDRAQAEARRREPDAALAPVDRRSIEIDQPQIGPALARRFRTGQHPQQSVEQRDAQKRASEPQPPLHLAFLHLP